MTEPIKVGGYFFRETGFTARLWLNVIEGLNEVEIIISAFRSRKSLSGPDLAE